MVFSANGIELWRKPVVTVTTSTRFGASAAATLNAVKPASASDAPISCKKFRRLIAGSHSDA